MVHPVLVEKMVDQSSRLHAAFQAPAWMRRRGILERLAKGLYGRRRGV